MARLKTLRKCGLLLGLSFKDLGILAHQVQEKKALPNQWLARKGDPSNGLIILSTGKLEIQLEDSTSKEELKAYDYFGELSLVSSEKRAVGVKCIESSDYLLLSPDSFKKLSEDFPEVAGKVSHAIAQSVNRKIVGIRDLLTNMLQGNA